VSAHWDAAEGLTLPGVEQPRARRRRWWRPLPKLGGLLVAMVLAGALVAGLALPWLGGAAALGQVGAGMLSPVTAELLDETPHGNTRIVAGDGSLITELFRRNRTVVPGDKIAPVMKDALVAIEDSRFYRHNGVDTEGLARALVRNVAAGEVVEGGSTLTQQLVKQIRLQTADSADERSAAVEEDLGRKLYEAQLAMGLEQEYSKDEILDRYLNRVYFGAGAYGIGAAARTYFGARASELTLAQAATLAGLVQSPTSYDPFTSPERAQARRDVVIGRMLTLGMITPAEADAARQTPVDVSTGKPTRNGCTDARTAGFFCDYVMEYLTGTVGLSMRRLEAGGLTIKTSLNPDFQKAGDAAVRAALAEDDPRAGIYTVVQPRTGRVIAMSVNRDYGLDASDPRQTTVNLHLAAGQGTGSTYKVFTAAEALARGYGLDHEIRTPDPYVSRVYEGPCKDRETDGRYCVRNAGNYPEELTLEEALYMSSNTYFLALEDELGSVAGPVRMAQRMGLDSIDPIADEVVAQNRGSFTFGAEATSPLALTNAYATLAGRGRHCEPSPVDAVLGPDGEPVTREDGSPLLPADRCSDVLKPGLADAINRALRKDVMPGFPGQTGAAAYIPGHQIAGKTGTSQDRYSATFVGYLPGLAASVMVYAPERNRNVGSFGGGIPAGIWRDAMAPILQWWPSEPFEDPPRAFTEGWRPEPERDDDVRASRDTRAPAAPVDGGMPAPAGP
jgi:membrane peptidoglycan carboxypeptidase